LSIYIYLTNGTRRAAQRSAEAERLLKTSVSTTGADFNVHISLSKSFRLAWESEAAIPRGGIPRVQPREFHQPEPEPDGVADVGRIQGKLPPRSMQFALRYEFQVVGQVANLRTGYHPVQPP
jgi:hypothetical protein